MESNGTMDVIIGCKIACKQHEIYDWVSENTERVVYLSV